jgi:hypothetical protein
MTPSLSGESSTGGEIDYSDFQTQMVRAFAFYTPPRQEQDGRGGIVVQHQIEPLQGIGGLANNEVAELVYLETNAVCDVFTGENDSADGVPLSPVHLDLSGIVGINLSARDDFVRSSSTDGKSEVVDEVQIEGDTDVDVTAIRAPTVTDNDRLQMFEAYAGGGHSNGNDGSNFSYTPFQDDKNYRATHNRGPVLDQTDEISILAESSTNGATNSDVDNGIVFETEVRLTMYWDVAETSDAGRRFSVPGSM